MPPEAGQSGGVDGPLENDDTAALARVREFLAVQVELHERAALLDRPWEEEFLH